MKLKEIEALIALIEKADIAEFDYSSADGERVYINKRLTANVIETPSPIAQQSTVETQITTTQHPTPKKDVAITITAPLVGTFYSASSPESTPFVAIGQNIKKGDVVCIIEAMKIMNQIRAEESGTVETILIQNGQPVEYGQVLFHLK